MDNHDKIAEIENNHDAFSRRKCICPTSVCTADCERELRRLRFQKDKTLRKFQSRDLVPSKNPNYRWLSLLYKEADSVMPAEIAKYFNGSKDRRDYDMNGDAELEIFVFLKAEFPTYADIVKHFEQYFIFPVKRASRDLDILLCSGFEIVGTPENGSEILAPVTTIYDNGFSCFNAFDTLFGSPLLFPEQVKIPEYKGAIDLFDFLPDRQGYKGLPQARLRCIFDSCGNEFEVLYETDTAFMLFNSGTS